MSVYAGVRLEGLHLVHAHHIQEEVPKAGLREQGKTVLFNSNILSDVGELCTRIAIMVAGRVVWQGGVDEALAESPDGLEAFFMRVVQA